MNPDVGIDRLVCLEIELNIEHPNTIGFDGFNPLPQESYSKHGPQLVKKKMGDVNWELCENETSAG